MSHWKTTKRRSKPSSLMPQQSCVISGSTFEASTEKVEDFSTSPPSSNQVGAKFISLTLFFLSFHMPPFSFHLPLFYFHLLLFPFHLPLFSFHLPLFFFHPPIFSFHQMCVHGPTGQAVTGSAMRKPHVTRQEDFKRRKLGLRKILLTFATDMKC